MNKIKDALFFIEGGIGHTFCMTAIFRKYKETYPERNVTVFAPPPWLAVLHRNEDIDFLYDNDNYLAKENIFKKGEYIIYKPDLYSNNLQIKSDDHIKTLIGKQCDVEIKRDDKLLTVLKEGKRLSRSL